MFTINYRGWYIHGFTDRPDCRVMLPNGGRWCNTKTLLGAKRIITKDSGWVKCREPLDN